ncbi:MAG: hypothetical protein AAF483_10865 [Planctomycetota bacterium]
MSRFEEYDFERSWLWMACDHVGQVATMHSLGDGAVLPGLSRSKKDAEWLRDWILDELIPEKNGSSDSDLCLENLHRISAISPGKSPEEGIAAYRRSIIEESSCGVFVYEASLGTTFPVGYHLLGTPGKPLLVSDLPEKPADIVSRCCFGTLSFGEASQIHLSNFGIQSDGRGYPE